jgi:hypothetical protein
MLYVWLKPYSEENQLSASCIFSWKTQILKTFLINSKLDFCTCVWVVLKFGFKLMWRSRTKLKLLIHNFVQTTTNVFFRLDDVNYNKGFFNSSNILLVLVKKHPGLRIQETGNYSWVQRQLEKPKIKIVKYINI